MTGAYCDLHLHSDRSDGTTPPEQVVELARQARLSAIALTDHDTVAGVPRAQEAGERLGVRVVPGVELSLEFEQGTFHLIALGIDMTYRPLLDAMARVQTARTTRNERLLARLAELGVPVTEEEVAEEAGDAVLGRPHVATVMVRRGYVSSIQDAFDRYLGRGKPAYVERGRLDLDEAVRVVRGAGGATVLCHPYTLGFKIAQPAGRAELKAFLREARTAGLDAIEVRCSAYTKANERFWETQARDADLLFSGGSDFHGARKPGVRVGVGRGRLRVPATWLDRLLERAATRT